MLRAAVAQGLGPDAIFEQLKREGRRLPGFGHPVHEDDPRTKVLLAMADEMGLSGAHTKLAADLENHTAHWIGKRLPLNVDGAIAALICDLGIDPRLGKAFFIIGRAAGFVAHAHEQVTAEKPFKAAAPGDISYTGPERREVSISNPNPK